MKINKVLLFLSIFFIFINISSMEQSELSQNKILNLADLSDEVIMILIDQEIKDHIDTYDNLFDLSLNEFKENIEEEVESIQDKSKICKISKKFRTIFHDYKKNYLINKLLQYRQDRLNYLVSKIILNKSHPKSNQDKLNQKLNNLLNKQNDIKTKDYLKKLLILVKKGADVNIKNKDNWTILMIFSEFGYTDIVDILISLGANLDTLSSSDQSALVIAAKGGNLDTVDLLLSKNIDIDNKNQALIEAVTQGHKNIVKLLLIKGAYINYQTPQNGYTSLMRAVLRGNKIITYILLKNNADINIKNKNGDKAIHLANNIEIIKLLLKKGTNINEKGTTGYTVLMRAAERLNIEMVKFLLNKRADITIQNNLGKTVLDTAKDPSPYDRGKEDKKNKIIKLIEEHIKKQNQELPVFVD